MIRVASRTVGDPSIASLLGLVARDDAGAFALLYDRLARSVYSLCLRVVGDAQLAEDATQETFVKLWRSAARYDEARGSGAAWVAAIARNAAVDRARRHGLVADEGAPEVDAGLRIDELAVRDDEAFRVHVALDLLGEQERRVIVLAYFAGLSHSQIAEHEGLPLGTVKSRTRTALSKLTDALAEASA